MSRLKLTDSEQKYILSNPAERDAMRAAFERDYPDNGKHPAGLLAVAIAWNTWQRAWAAARAAARAQEAHHGAQTCPESGKHCLWVGGECQTCGAVGVPEAPVGVEAGEVVKGLMRADEIAVLRAVADRIVGNAHPEEDGRLDIAYAIARYLGLDWPAAQQPAEGVQAGEVADAEVWLFKGTDGAWHTFHNEQHRLDTIADGRWDVRKFTALSQQAEARGVVRHDLCDCPNGRAEHSPSCAALTGERNG